MKGYHSNIEKLTLENENFRKVLYTARYSQIVLMSLKPGEEIGSEVHDDGDQFFRFEKGKGKAIIDSNEYEVEDGHTVIVPAGSEHNVINTSNEDLKLYTLYCPPHHRDGVIHETKQQALVDDEHFEGITTE